MDVNRVYEGMAEYPSPSESADADNEVLDEREGTEQALQRRAEFILSADNGGIVPKVNNSIVQGLKISGRAIYRGTELLLQ